MAVMCLEETGDSLANRTRLVRQLLDQGMPADYSDDGKTLLHTCARKGLTSFAKELIDRGANVNARFDDLKETMGELEKPSGGPRQQTLLQYELIRARERPRSESTGGMR